MAESPNVSKILAKESRAILRSNKELVLYPLVAAIFFFATLAILSVPVFIWHGVLYQNVIVNGNPDSLSSKAIYLICAFIFYFLSAFYGVFFTAGLTAEVVMRLRGENPTFRDGIRKAKECAGRIFVYSLIAATVGVVLQVIQGKAQKDKDISEAAVGAIGGLAWNLATFFIVPVLIYEDLGIFVAIKRSAEILKNSWKETLAGELRIAGRLLVYFLLGIIPVGVAFYLGYTGWGIILFMVLIAFLIILFFINEVLIAVLKGVLYHYVVSGTTPEMLSVEAKNVLNNFSISKPQIPSQAAGI